MQRTCQLLGCYLTLCDLALQTFTTFDYISSEYEREHLMDRYRALQSRLAQVRLRVCICHPAFPCVHSLWPRAYMRSTLLP
jgi:hypothetical protein